jgi:excisionase family DNA binding protein
MAASWLTPRQVANRLKLSRRTLDRWRQERKGPAWHKLGGRVLYRADEFAAWIEASRQRLDEDLESERRALASMGAKKLAAGNDGYKRAAVMAAVIARKKAKEKEAAKRTAAMPAEGISASSQHEDSRTLEIRIARGGSLASSTPSQASEPSPTNETK